MSRSAKKYVKKEPIIKVDFNIRTGYIYAQNMENSRDGVCCPFSGTIYPGFFDKKSFSNDRLEDLREDLINDYISKHPSIKEKRLEKVIKLVDENVNLSIYEILKKYDDSNYWKGIKSDKAYKYINAMAKPINKRYNETEDEYKRRVLAERKRMLKRAGISCDFDLSGIISSPVPLTEKIKVLKMASKSKQFANIKFDSKLIKNKRNISSKSLSNMKERDQNKIHIQKGTFR